MERPTIKDTKTDQIFNILNYLLLIIVLITILYPLIYIVSASFSSYNATISGKVWLWPVEFTLEGYKAVFEHKKIWNGFLNSIIYTVFGTFVNVIMTLIAAYPLSRKDFYGRNVIMFFIVFTMLFTGGLIPTFLLVQDLGLLDTRLSMILPNAIAVWNLIITRTFFQTTIPQELLDAAQIDGSNDYNFLIRIVMPLSKPIIAVLTLFYAVGHWNQYFQALIYLRSESLYPLQLVLRDILIQNEIDLTMLTDVETAAAKEGLRELLKYSLIIVASLPVLILYPFVQRHFVRGIMIGSLKQ